MAETPQFKSVHELEALPMDARIQYFLEHPIEDQPLPAEMTPEAVAKARARTIDTIARRDREQAQARRAS